MLFLAGLFVVGSFVVGLFLVGSLLTGSRPAFGCRGVLVVGACLALSAGTAGVVPAASAAFTPHPTLVPQVPSRGYPVILKTTERQSYAVEQAGNAIVSGGDFQEIELQNGTIIQQPHFAAWDVDSKQMLCQQKFVFNKPVLAVEPGPTPTTVYVGGKFSKVTGADGVARSRGKVALIDLADCSVSTDFVPGSANGKVTDIEYGGGRLFVGGDFTSVGGNAVETVAELDPANGAYRSAFNFTTAGESSSRIRGMELNPANTRLIIAGRFGAISRAGVSISAPTAVINIANPAAPVLTNHRSSGVTTPIADLLDAAISPDGSRIGLAYGTATNSDYVYLIPTTESTVSYTWRHFMRDSSFGIGVSNNAVYVAGHFCKPDAGPGASVVMAPVSGLDTCTGSTRFTGGVWRSHLAALSLADGTPLEWNPGQSSFTGGRAVTVTSRGLLVGYDGERTADRKVGTTAFFDFNA
jgi:trimeric autotransporter adhesin